MDIATPALTDINLYQSDPILQQLCGYYQADAINATATKLGQEVSSEQWQQDVIDANRYPPELQRFDAFGQYSNQVSYNPAYHRLMQHGKHYQLHSLAWDKNIDQAQVKRAVLYYVYAQTDQGPTCPLTMTYAVIPVIMQHQSRYDALLQQLMSSDYDARFIHYRDKAGITMGMGMTEKQGGSDVRANETHASNDGDFYQLNGHKWFCSAPMSDAFLMLAQLPEGLTCFFVPRFRPDGTQNGIVIQRLKHKLGNHSNASSEIELQHAYAERVGEPGRGVATIIQMVNHTRFDCALGSSAHMRQALVQAIHHAQHRHTFRKRLIDHSLMQNVLADAALESEAAIRISLWLANALDNPNTDTNQAIIRLGTAIAKYWVCKRTPMLVNEMLECLGGNGYTEDLPLARLYRDAPLNSIWEGSGNIQCLDVLRAIQHKPEQLELLVNNIKHGLDNASFQQLQATIAACLKSDDPSYTARHFTETLARAIGASLMNQQANRLHADAYLQSRLGSQRSFCFGGLPTKHARVIVDNSFTPVS